MKIRTSILRSSGTVAGFLLILMWAYAAFSKLFARADFETAIRGHGLIKPYAPFLSWAVPIAELLIVAFLFFNYFKKTGLLLSVGLLTLFTIYIVYMFMYYPNTPCSCGGIISSLSWKLHIVFNVFFMGLSVVGILLLPREEYNDA